MRIRNAEAMVSATTKSPMSQSAEDAYIAVHAKTLEILRRIEGAMFDMPAPDSETLINWAHVGTVTEMNRQLSAVLEFVQSNSERENQIKHKATMARNTRKTYSRDASGRFASTGNTAQQSQHAQRPQPNLFQGQDQRLTRQYKERRLVLVEKLNSG